MSSSPYSQNGNETCNAQRTESTAKRQTSSDPAEMGSNADAAFPFPLPGDGATAGAEDGSLFMGMFIPGAVAAADVGEDSGERLPPSKNKIIRIQIR